MRRGKPARGWSFPDPGAGRGPPCGLAEDAAVGRGYAGRCIEWGSPARRLLATDAESGGGFLGALEDAADGTAVNSRGPKVSNHAGRNDGHHQGYGVGPGRWPDHRRGVRPPGRRVGVAGPRGPRPRRSPSCRDLPPTRGHRQPPRRHPSRGGSLQARRHSGGPSSSRATTPV